MATHPIRPRTWLAAATLALALAPAAAQAAGGLNLAWNHCLGSGLGVQNLAFACDTNLGNRVMTGSFVLSSDFPQVIGDEIVLQLASASPALPEWWQFVNAGTCRPSALSANFVPDPADVACVDWSSGAQLGGLGTYCTVSGPCVDHPATANAARIKVIAAVAPQNAADLVAGVEYFSFHVMISNVKTVGTGSCAGCDVPVCIVLNSINVVDAGNLHPRFLSASTAPGTNFISWQGGGVPVVAGTSGCPAATATRRSAWGELKTLYR